MLCRALSAIPLREVDKDVGDGEQKVDNRIDKLGGGPQYPDTAPADCLPNLSLLCPSFSFSLSSAAPSHFLTTLQEMLLSQCLQSSDRLT